MDEAGAAYLRALEARYVALRGRGYMLSARDVDRVLAWRERGVPLNVALRVVEEGTLAWRRSQRRVGAPRSLSFFERPVREAVQRRAHLGLDASRPEAAAPGAGGAGAGDQGRQSPWSAPLGALEVAGKAQGDDAVRAVLRRAWRRLRAGREADEDVWALTAEVDAAIVVELAEVVGAATLEVLRAEAAAALEPTAGERMSEQARQERYRFELNQRLRDRASVPELLEVLLEQSL